MHTYIKYGLFSNPSICFAFDLSCVSHKSCDLGGKINFKSETVCLLCHVFYCFCQQIFKYLEKTKRSHCHFVYSTNIRTPHIYTVILHLKCYKIWRYLEKENLKIGIWCVRDMRNRFASQQQYILDGSIITYRNTFE